MSTIYIQILPVSLADLLSNENNIQQNINGQQQTEQNEQIMLKHLKNSSFNIQKELKTNIRSEWWSLVFV